MATYRTTIFGDEIKFSANFAEASSQVIGDPRGRQVADFRHSPAIAMRAIIEDDLAISGLRGEDGKFSEQIESVIASAVAAMKETD